ncbi:MAG TPA: VOC family protein [Dissulfurispiraceae bacterium]|nr:VOC family protein [Dissulfurispiraceae bacterium]
MQLTKLTPELVVNDIKETISFYQDMLGFELVLAVPNPNNIDWALMSCGEVEIMFHAKVGRHAKKHVAEDVTFHFEGAGVKELYESVKNKVRIGRHLYPTFYGTNEFSMRDNNGCTLVFSEKMQQEEEDY